MSTRTPRRAARFSAEISAGSGRKYGVTICTDVCASASAASNVKRGLFKIRVRSVRDDPGDDVAGIGQFGKPFAAFENFSGAKRPVIDEGLLQLGDDRAFDAELQILHRAFGFIGEHISLADVHAAGEGDFSVHDRAILRWLRRLMVATRHGVSSDVGRNRAKGIFARCNLRVTGGHE